jgi:hypothetical protein
MVRTWRGSGIIGSISWKVLSSNPFLESEREKYDEK